MKTTLTCTFLLLLATFSNGQNNIPQPHHYHADPNSAKPPVNRVTLNSNSRSVAQACDTGDVLDYSTYNENFAALNGLVFNGTWNGTPAPVASELSSFIDTFSANQQYFNYAEVNFDSICFANLTDNSTLFYPRSASTIYLDSMGMFIGVYGDTSLSGAMLHDSIIFTVYPVNGTSISATPAQKIIYGGRSQLGSFLVGPNYLQYVQIPIHQQFNQGQGFAVRMDYLNKDTSSHCILSYTYADSCGTYTQGGVLYAYPAYPSPVPGTSYFGSIVNNGGVASVADQNSSFTYAGTGYAPNCSYLYWQNWYFLPIVDICVTFGTRIGASSTTACANQIVSLNADVYGTTNAAGATYSWSASSGTLSSTSIPSPDLTMSIANNVTVTVDVNDGTGDVFDTIIIANCIQVLSANLGNNQTVCNGSYLILNAHVTGGNQPYTYAWANTGDALSCNNCANPTVTLTQNSTYSVTVTDANSVTATASVSYSVSGTSNTLLLNLVNAGSIYCNLQIDTTTATVQNGTAPFNYVWGDGSSGQGTATAVHDYTQAGTYVISVTDASGCITSQFDTIKNTGVAVALGQTIDPNCIGQGTGSININVTGGITPYTYYWSDGSNGASLTNVQAGNYAVSVYDINLCSATLSYFLNPVHDDWGYYVYLNTTDANCSNNGVVTATVQSGTPPFTYNWNTGATTPGISNLGAGIYTLTVTDFAGCPRVGTADVSINCYSIISGTVFVDSNQNCVFDAGDWPVQNDYVTVYGNNQYYYGYTDANGNFSVSVPSTGTFNLSVEDYGGACSNFALCGNPGNNITITHLGDSSANNNITATYTSGYDLAVHPGWTSADPGFQKEYWIYAYNQSAVPFNGQATVTFAYDPSLIYQSSQAPLPVVDTFAHTLTWSLTGVSNFWDSWLDNYFLVPASLSLSYQLQSDFTITPTVNDCDSSNNHYHFSETVIGSHDPNEKTVEPANSISADDSTLYYTIHFQNTGSDSTWFITVKDTLSPNLDPATVRNVASSHTYSKFTIVDQGILTWVFNPYRLPDSLTNARGSQGFVSFTVKKKKNLPIGTLISNRASVYFDYNKPILTNQVVDTVAMPLYIAEVKSDNNITVKVFPNPFADLTHIVIDGLKGKYDFELYDVTGRLKKKITSIENNQFDLQRDNLAQGIYFYRIVVSSQQLAYGKLVVQ